MTLQQKIIDIAKRAKKAAPIAAGLTTEIKNKVLFEMADALLMHSKAIEKANKLDVAFAQKKKLSPAMIDRLILNEKRIEDMAKGLKEVSALPDPAGEVVQSYDRPNGLNVSRVRIPLGVIGIIYESRPNVTIDAAGLCLKSGNVVILRGGSEALHSNLALGKIARQVLKKNHINPDLIQVIDTADRKAMEILVTLTPYIDLMIPRGGESLMKWMNEHSRVPVVKHDKGICHVFVDEKADIPMALNIAFNSKTHRPGVCNTMETLLVHEKIASRFLPQLFESYSAANVEIHGDPASKKILPKIKRATAKDWDTEYLDLIVNLRVVKNMDQAIEHIRDHGSNHTESIVTEDPQTAERFLSALDSSMVAWNASTRFNDGGQLGLGAEIGISTTKLHAFGPMGLQELTTTKFVVRGNGQIRA